MKYKCKHVSATQLLISGNGIIQPLCDKCKSNDCSNSIEKIKMSILGIKRDVRVLNKGIEPRIVIECEGFLE